MRRRLLGTAVLGVAALQCGLRVRAAAAAPEAVAPSVALCRFLTGWQGLDARVVSRAFAALSRMTPGFEDRAHALWNAIAGADLKTVQDFRNSPVYLDGENRDTVGMLVAAIYLGVVGDGDAATLVSYEAALMFAPTQDLTPIPSYAIGGPAYWDARG
jgi:hypothetical protein